MSRYKFLTVTLLVGFVLTQFIPQASAASLCDVAKFISDVTVPSGASFPPGAAFTKVWRVQNIGACTWTTGYSLGHYSNEQMGFTAYNLNKPVAPGEMVDISINLVAPMTGGLHDGTWLLSNASGVRFQVGPGASMPLWVSIFVVQSDMVAFDFVANAPYAQWKSGAGPLPYPGTSGDSRGYAMKVDSPRLEDGSLDPQPGLLTVPQNKFDGYIQATYPEFLVQGSDRLQLLVNCEYNATGCYVTFRVDYMTSSGSVNTFWKFKEAYEGKVYRADINLDSLAGQNIRFILMVLGTGTASGDRALWGAPRILRMGNGTPPPPPTVTSLPPLTPTATPFSTPPIVSPSICDKAAFVADVTVADGTLFSPGAAFTKTWRLKNVGYCTWTNSYSIVFYSGEQMSAPTSVNFPWSVAPGQSVDITVNMVAPNTEGKYRGFWILRNSSGALFGIGKSSDSPFWVEINVSGGTLNEMGYNFWANVCSAQWRSGSGILPCPGTEGDSKGFVIQSNYTHLEDGTMGPAPSLLTAPENRYNGYIQGIYPAITVLPGDRFYTNVGCEYGHSCYVTFRLDYMTASGAVKTFWTRREQNEGQNHTVDVSLTPLAGQSVRFILTVLATGSANNDHVRWIVPYIMRVGGPPPTSSATPEPGLIIRGRVTKDGAGVPNVDIYRTFANYSGQLVATTDANGYYVSDFWYIPGDETVNVWAVQEGYAFDPPVYNWRHYHGSEDRTLNFTASYAVTATPLPDQWPLYTNPQYGFQFKYPNGGEVVAGSNANLARINLPFQSGTTLVEKYMNVVVVENANPCRSPLAIAANVMTSQNVTINGITFLKEEAGEGAVGHFYKWVAYSTLRGNACISLEFVLHSINPGVYSTPPPMYNEPAETTVFYDIVTHFAWLNFTATPLPDDWLGYTNPKYGFKFRYPPRLEDQPNTDPNYHRIDLSFAPGTNLTQKYLEVTVVENANPCQSPRVAYSILMNSENVTINGIPFLKQTGMDAGMSKLNEWVAYSTLKGNACISMSFILHSVYAIDPPPPLFDKVAESIVFTDIMSTFGWLDVTETPSPTPTLTSSPVTNLPDLMIIEKRYELQNSNCLLPGDVFGVRVWVKNQGQAAAGSFTVQVNEAQQSVNGLGIGEITPVFFPGMGSTVTIVIDPTSAVAESDETNNSFAGMLAVPTPPFPCTVTPTLTPSLTPTATQTQTALIGPYAVVLVAVNDVLNIRSGPGVSNPVIGSFAREAVNVMRTGPSQQAEGAEWVEVLMPDGISKGWVNFKYLTEYVSQSAFCTDMRIASLIEQLKQAMTQSNGSLLGSLVSPKHGLNMNYWPSSDTINYTSASVQTVFTDPQVINWGSGGGSGVNDSGTFAQIVQPQLVDVLGSAYQLNCEALSYGQTYTNVASYTNANIHFYSVVKPSTNVMDWKVWLIRIEYVNGQPYLFGAVHYVWEP